MNPYQYFFTTLDVYAFIFTITVLNYKETIEIFLNNDLWIKIALNHDP